MKKVICLSLVALLPLVTATTALAAQFTLSFSKPYVQMPSAFYPHCYRFGERWGDLDLEEGVWIPPLMVDPAGEEKIFCRVTVYVMNANTEQAEKAIEFLEHVARFDAERFPFRTIMMNPDANTPIPSQHYIQSKNEAEMIIMDLEDRLPNADRQDALVIQDEIDSILSGLKEEDQWLVSAEEITNYRRIAPYLTLENGQPLQEGDPLFDQLYATATRFVQGAEHIERTIQEMDRIMTTEFSERIDAH